MKTWVLSFIVVGLAGYLALAQGPVTVTICEEADSGQRASELLDARMKGARLSYYDRTESRRELALWKPASARSVVVRRSVAHSERQVRANTNGSGNGFDGQGNGGFYYDRGYPAGSNGSGNGFDGRSNGGVNDYVEYAPSRMNGSANGSGNGSGNGYRYGYGDAHGVWHEPATKETVRYRVCQTVSGEPVPTD